MVLGNAVVTLDLVVLQPESGVREVLLLPAEHDVRGDVHALLGVDVTDHCELAVGFG